MSSIIEQMTPQQIIDMIAILTKVVEANRGLFGSESTLNEANRKIKELIALIK